MISITTTTTTTITTTTTTKTTTKTTTTKTTTTTTKTTTTTATTTTTTTTLTTTTITTKVFFAFNFHRRIEVTRKHQEEVGFYCISKRTKWVEEPLHPARSTRSM